MLKSLMSGLMLTVAVAGSAVFAAEWAPKSSGKNLVNAKPATQVTSQQVGEILDNLGYEVKNIGTSKKLVYQLIANRHGLKVPVNVCLSMNQKILWLQANLAKSPEKPSAECSLKFLTVNTGKSFFVIEHKLVRMYRPVDNVHITPRLVRMQLDIFLENVCDTKHHWLPQPSTPTVAKK